MGTEVERKFLVCNDSWRSQTYKHAHYRQGYLSSDKGCSIRVRIAGDRGYLNIKSATLSVTRKEYEYQIPREDADELLDQLCHGPLIEKTRYFVKSGNHVWEIDLFEGDNAGLIVAEIELAHEDEPFARPEWLGEEVSHDPRYYNVCLVKHPYKDWEDS